MVIETAIGRIDASRVDAIILPIAREEREGVPLGEAIRTREPHNLPTNTVIEAVVRTRTQAPDQTSIKLALRSALIKAQMERAKVVVMPAMADGLTLSVRDIAQAMLSEIVPAGSKGGQSIRVVGIRVETEKMLQALNFELHRWYVRLTCTCDATNRKNGAHTFWCPSGAPMET